MAGDHGGCLLRQLLQRWIVAAFRVAAVQIESFVVRRGLLSHIDGIEFSAVEPRGLSRQGPALADPGLLFEACHQ